MRQLKQKNIIELIEFIETDEFYFIVLELAPGGEIFHEIVRLTYFSEDLSRHVIIQVAEAVRYLHEIAGVVHRDIKPENLLYFPIPFSPCTTKKGHRSGDEDKEDEGEFIPGLGAGGIGTIKLADFGLSKIIWDSNTMTPCGTVGYTAPEIVNDQRYSKSVDMWALGCVLYTILCGFPPFYDESIQLLTEKVAKGEYTFLSPWWDDISNDAKDLVSHLLTVDPKRRYNINQFLNHPWILNAKQPLTALTSLTAKSKPSEVPLSADVNFATPRDEVVSSLGGSEGALTAKAGHTPGMHIPMRAGDKGRSGKAFFAMKEAFDVFNAVHRMEEENVNHRAGRFLLDGLGEEEEEEEDEVVDLEEQLRRARIDNDTPVISQAVPARRATPRKVRNKVPNSIASSQMRGPPTGRGNNFFELSLDTSTLLERRRRDGHTGTNNPPTASTASTKT